MKDIERDIRDFFDSWLLEHIRGIFLNWAIVSIVTGASYFLSANTDYVSIYDKLLAVMNWVWVVDTGFFCRFRKLVYSYISEIPSTTLGRT